MATSTIKKGITRFGAETGSYFHFTVQGGTWTASGNGIAIARVVWNTSRNAGYAYLYDNTSEGYAATLSTPDANGLSVTSSFPVFSGHEYVVNGFSNADYIDIYFYPFI